MSIYYKDSSNNDITTVFVAGTGTTITGYQVNSQDLSTSIFQYSTFLSVAPFNTGFYRTIGTTTYDLSQICSTPPINIISGPTTSNISNIGTDYTVAISSVGTTILSISSNFIITGYIIGGGGNGLVNSDTRGGGGGGGELAYFVNTTFTNPINITIGQSSQSTNINNTIIARGAQANGIGGGNSSTTLGAHGTITTNNNITYCSGGNGSNYNSSIGGSGGGVAAKFPYPYISGEFGHGGIGNRDNTQYNGRLGGVRGVHGGYDAIYGGGGGGSDFTTTGTGGNGCCLLTIYPNLLSFVSGPSGVSYANTITYLGNNIYTIQVSTVGTTIFNIVGTPLVTGYIIGGGGGSLYMYDTLNQVPYSSGGGGSEVVAFSTTFSNSITITIGAGGTYTDRLGINGNSSTINNITATGGGGARIMNNSMVGGLGGSTYTPAAKESQGDITTNGMLTYYGGGGGCNDYFNYDLSTGGWCSGGVAVDFPNPISTSTVGGSAGKYVNINQITSTYNGCIIYATTGQKISAKYGGGGLHTMSGGDGCCLLKLTFT
jgi:hypothetical protein